MMSYMPVFQLKITLDDTQPPIWRRVLVASDVTLEIFHRVIQAAMGWEMSHLYEFKVDRVRFTLPFEEGDLYERTAIDTRNVRLAHIVPVRKPFRGEFQFDMTYLYDFGDGWKHTIVFEDILPSDPARKIPVCLDGERACPPENIGGVWGYKELLESGAKFDAEAFPKIAINKRLAKIR